jgi:two-component system, OmpR family, sensor histidine kinase VicK
VPLSYRKTSFKRQALLLFFITSLLPAMTVSTLWYLFTRESGSVNVEIGRYVAPLALLGLAPAAILSWGFAELLVGPIKRIHEAVNQLAAGNLNYRVHFGAHTEFAAIAEGLDRIAADLQQIISQSQGENELVNAERSKLRSVLDAMSDAVVAVDSGNSIVLYNKVAAQLTGLPMAALAGQQLEKVLSLRLNQEPVMEEWLQRPKGSPAVGEWNQLELLRQDGEVRYVDVHAVILDHDPSGFKALMTMHDSSKEVQLEEMKIDFVALAAHELRTPLTSIKGYLDILKMEMGNKFDKTQLNFLNRTIIGAEQLMGLVNNLLNVSRIEHGDISYTPEPTNWHNFLAKVAQDLTPQATHQGRKFVIHIPKRLPLVAVDSFAVTEVVSNLIQNAVKRA